MKKVLVVLVVLVVLAVAALVVIGGSIGTAIEAGVETVAPKATGSTVTLNNVDVSLLGGAASLNGFVVGNPEGFKTSSAFELGDVKVKLDLGSLSSDTIVIKQILIDGAQVTWEGSLKGSNIGRIQKNVETFVSTLTSGESAPEEESEEEAGETKVVIEEFVFSNAKVRLSVTLAQGKAMTIPIKDIRLTDIGKEEEPKTMGETINEIMPEVFKGIREAVVNKQELLKDPAGMLKEGGATLQDAGTKLKDVGSKVGGKIKGLFGR
ncbi:MAG: hypothetical protein ACYTGH_15635 [Planctomycetota bacterium]|jgi:uncharacterized protein involved in outer membrane biogenesis